MDKAIAGVEPLNAFKLLYFMNLNILAFSSLKVLQNVALFVY